MRPSLRWLRRDMLVPASILGAGAALPVNGNRRLGYRRLQNAYKTGSSAFQRVMSDAEQHREPLGAHRPAAAVLEEPRPCG